ncbi:MAG TPA: ATP-binding protein [Azospirillum sp.]|nr:ATP-binding protein [Azospirillum sp.]
MPKLSANERLLAWAMTLGLVGGIGLFSALAYLDRQHTLDEAEETLHRTVTLMEGHARVAIQAQGVVLSEMVSLLETADPAELRQTPAAWERLQRLKAETPMDQSLWIIDSEGDMALTSVPRAPPTFNVRNREYFLVHTGPEDVGTFIGPMIRGRITGDFLFTVSRAARNPDGTLRSVAQASIDVSHFTTFYESLKPVPGTAFTIFRENGDVVVRFPLPEDEHKINSSGSLLFSKIVKEAPEGTFIARSAIDGVERLGAYKWVDGWPLIVATGVPIASVFDAWWARTQRSGFLTGAVLVGLCGMFGFGIRKARRERLAEAAAAAANRRLNLVLDTAGAGVFSFDPVTGAVEWGPGVRTIFGFTDDEPPSLERWRQVILPEDLERTGSVFQQAIAARNPEVTVEYRARHPTLGMRWVLASMNIFYGPYGTPLRIVGVNLDVTRLKLAETEALRAKDQALHAKAEAERANLSKSKFLAAASHDLRQPVQSLVLLLALIEPHARERPELARSVGMMEGALGALNRLLSSLLDVSRLDAGVIAPRPTEVSVNELLEKLGGEYRLRAAQKGLRLRLRMASAGAWLRTDPVLLERVLRNLAENALQYTHEGSILFACRRRNGKVLLQVFDTGVGIPEDQQEAVFEEFFQMHNPGRDHVKGLGLGLSIVKRIARLLGATVTLRSRPGHGSCFTITLDEAPAPKDPATPPAPPDQTTDDTVLIIEDDAIVRIGLEMMAQAWGYGTAVAASGETAVDMVAQDRIAPDAIVADYRLGEGINGVGAVLAIREALGRQVPAVIVTGDTAPERIQEVHASGIGILHKPYGAEELRLRLSELLTGRREGTERAESGNVG